MPNTRDALFDRVVVNYMYESARIHWQLRADIPVDDTMHFRVEYSETGLSNADDWEAVSSELTSTLYFTDPVQRSFIESPRGCYRVRATRGDSTVVYSQPTACWGQLNRADWLKARALARREFLRTLKKAGSYGWLYKRRWRGTAITDPRVVDPLTGEVVTTINTAGHGTAIVGGYYTPAPFHLDLNVPQQRYNRRDADRGQVDEQLVPARCLAFPQLDHGDIWADAVTGARYAIHEVGVVARVRSTPVVCIANIRKLHPSDPVFEIELPAVPTLTQAERAEM